jgi:hypothetical protein
MMQVTPHADARIFMGLGPFGAMLRPDQKSFARFDSASIKTFHAEQMVRDAMRAGLVPADMREDATLTMAFARELEYILAKVYEADYPQFKATQLIPVNTSIPAGALTFTYRRVDIGAGGQAKIVNTYSDDLPRSDVNAKEWQQPIVTIASSYEFSVQDMAAAAYSGIPIEAYKARASRFACDYLLEQLACFGNAGSGLVGITNAPGVYPTSQVSTGTWLAQIAAIAAATPSNPYTATAAVSGICADIAAMINKVVVATLNTHRPDTMLVDVPIWTALTTTIRSPVFTEDTLLDYIRKVFRDPETQEPLDVQCWPIIGTAAANGHGRTLVYKKDEDLLELMISQPFTQLPPQPINLAWQVPCMERTGAVQVRSPLTITYMDGLD